MSKLPTSPAPIPAIDLAVGYDGPPCVYACSQCGALVAHSSRIVSTAFRGHSGKAALFNDIKNIALDPPSILLMDSGAYTIAEFICTACDAYLGWQFVRAHDGPERWKEGLYILELDFVVPQDAPSPAPSRALPPSPLSLPQHDHQYSPANASPHDGEDDAYSPDGEPALGLAPELAVYSPLVQMQMQIADGAHRRAMSDTHTHPRPSAREGHRSLQPGAKPQPQPGPYVRARRDGEEYQGGPFWKPR